MPSLRVSLRTWVSWLLERSRKVSIPESMYSLIEATPSSTIASRWLRHSGSCRALSETPPHSMKSTCALAWMAISFSCRFAREVTGGSEVHGMSTTHVTPPAAAALVPVSKSSRWVNPGSSKWTCPSITPGRTSSPPRSMTSSSVSAGAEPGVHTSAIRPSMTRISAAAVASPAAAPSAAGILRWVNRFLMTAV